MLQSDPRAFKIGFETLPNATIDVLIDEAYQQGIKNHSNLTVASTFIDGDLKKPITFFITPEKGIIPVQSQELKSKLAEFVNQRVSKKHYKTEVNKESNYATEFSKEITVFQEYVDKLWKLNLFEPYFENSNMHFGFVATRVSNGEFLITSRGSNKKDIPLEDIVHVSEVDFNSRTIYVNSLGKKASLNANVAAKIFQERPEVNVILHAHVSPCIENKTSTDYSPGTQEDVDEVWRYLQNGEKIVELVNHGIISVGTDLEEVIKTLDVEPAYNKFPELYDAIYHRFQQSTEFIDLVSKVTRPNETILDLAAGTGDVSKQLLERGYANISLADKSKGMLNVAKAKLGKELPTYVTSIKEMDLGRTYNLIIVRQAINYLMDYNGLVDGLKKIYGHLSNGGRLVFNAPNFTEDIKYEDRVSEYEYRDYNVRVKEMNNIEGRVLTHTQNCVLTKKDGSEIKKVYDLNKFGLFTKAEFDGALREAGFNKINFLGKELKEFNADSKTLYCVAIK